MKSINWVLGENIDYRNVVLCRGQIVQLKPSVFQLFKYPRSVFVSWTVSFLQSIMDYGFVLWAPTLLALVLKIPATQAAKMFIAVAFASIVGKFVWAFMSELVGRRLR